MDQEYPAYSQHRLIAVGGVGRRYNAPGKKAGEEGGEHHDEAGASYDGDAPENGPVVELLQIAEAVRLRLFGGEAEPVKDGPTHILDVLGGGDHQQWLQALADQDGMGDVEQMVCAVDQQHPGSRVVDELASLQAAEAGDEPLADSQLVELLGQPREGEGEEARHHEEVLSPLVDVEAHNIA